MTMFWPRFKQIFDLNVNCIKTANPKQLWKGHVHAHYVTRRSSSIYVLNLDFANDMLQRDMNTLQKETEKLLHKLSLEYQNKQKSAIFLINNYDLILTVLREHHVGADDCV